jgi:hypothetical protein
VPITLSGLLTGSQLTVEPSAALVANFAFSVVIFVRPKSSSFTWPRGVRKMLEVKTLHGVSMVGD